MTNQPELKTLGDYRKTARELLYFYWSYKENKNNSDYDTIRNALLHIKFLIISFRAASVTDGIWRTFHLLKTKDAEYQIRNLLLFEIIKLMEVSFNYKGKTIDEIFPEWPKRPDVNAMIFTTAGISYLEAAFNFVNDIGKSIILSLQNAYMKFRKESNIGYFDPFKFLRKTPTVDDLVISPEPDVIIKYWFEDILKKFQNCFPEQEYSQNKVEAEFNSTLKQLDYEWNTWKKTSAGDMAGYRKRGTPETTELKLELLRDQVFICYSHKDKRWLDDLQTHLKPNVRNGSITAWSDEQIVPGSKWFSKIKVALAATKVAVLLITPHFLASDFIHEHELTPILKEVEKSNVCIIWIPVRACSYKETALKDYQAAIDPDKPLANMKAERDKAWVRICEEIKKAFSR